MTFYNVFDMRSPYSKTLFDATGYFTDFVLVAYQNQIHVLRQFAIPLLVIFDIFSDFTILHIQMMTKFIDYQLQLLKSLIIQ
jgi:hypothetical protein